MSFLFDSSKMNTLAFFDNNIEAIEQKFSFLFDVKNDLTRPVSVFFYERNPVFHNLNGAVTYTNESNTFWSPSFTSLFESIDNLKNIIKIFDSLLSRSTSLNNRNVSVLTRYEKSYQNLISASLFNYFNIKTFKSFEITHVDDLPDSKTSFSEPFLIDLLNFKKFQNENNNNISLEIDLVLRIYNSFQFIYYVVKEHMTILKDHYSLEEKHQFNLVLSISETKIDTNVNQMKNSFNKFKC